MVLVALLSNPKSTGNRQLLPRVRSYCAGNQDIFHYEVECVEQIGRAMQMIAHVKPAVLVINGGDGTVQTALTELYQGHYFEGASPPPVAVLPNGKTNLIALDLGIRGDPIKALEQIVAIAREGVQGHVVARELIDRPEQSEPWAARESFAARLFAPRADYAATCLDAGVAAGLLRRGHLMAQTRLYAGPEMLV